MVDLTTDENNGKKWGKQTILKHMIYIPVELSKNPEKKKQVQTFSACLLRIFSTVGIPIPQKSVQSPTIQQVRSGVNWMNWIEKSHLFWEK